MSLTKQQLQDLCEADLRVQVLIPLFKAMKFNDVTHYHGGAGEQGKDITMWMPSVLGDREYYAVVVKAGRISGAATGRGSAAEVQMQIAQALGSKFTDTADLSERQATRCWVISTDDIRKEATESIKNALGPRAAEGSVRFIDGDELWSLIERHLPERTIAQTLAAAGQVLDNLSEHHRVVTQLRGNAIHLSLEPKYDGAGAMESTAIVAEFAFPETDEVRSLVDAVKSHIALGTPVTIPGAFLTRFDVPKPLEPFLKSGPIDSIVIGPISSEREVRMTLIARGTSGAELRLPGVRFRATRIGSEEMELTCRSGDMPWRSTLTLNTVTKAFSIAFSAPGGAPSAKQALDGARFMKTLSDGGGLHFVNDETGLELFSCDLTSGVIPPPDAGWLRFLESLWVLQQKCQVAVTVLGDISAEDARDVVEVADQIQSGVSAHPLSRIRLRLRAGAPRDLFRTDNPNGLCLGIAREEFLNVAGVRFPLGVVARIATRARLTEESRAVMENTPLGNEIEVELEAIDEASQLWVAHLKWLNEEQTRRVHELAPGMSFEVSDSPDI